MFILSFYLQDIHTTLIAVILEYNLNQTIEQKSLYNQY